MDASAALDLYRRWIEELWNGDLSVADHIVSEDFVGHWPDREVSGRSELVAAISELHDMFASISFAIEVGPIVQGDLVAARWSGRGAMPDGKTMVFTGNDILRIAGDRFAEFWQASSAGT